MGGFGDDDGSFSSWGICVAPRKGREAATTMATMTTTMTMDVTPSVAVAAGSVMVMVMAVATALVVA